MSNEDLGAEEQSVLPFACSQVLCLCHWLYFQPVIFCRKLAKPRVYSLSVSIVDMRSHNL